MTHRGPSDPSGHRTEQPVVFFVDDDEALRRSVAKIVARGGYRYLEAATAADAVRVAEGFPGPIDVLLMDLNLPDGWGASLVPPLLDIHPEMRVVYTTGFAASDPVLAGGLDAVPFAIEKPFEPDELLAILREARGDGDGPPG